MAGVDVPDMSAGEAAVFGMAWTKSDLDGMLDLLAQRDRRIRAEALRDARAVVERQTDLTELVHFERPSDFRKGVLTCLAALDAHIKASRS